MKKKILLVALLISILCCMNAYAGWKQEGGEWHYYDTSGNLVRNEFKNSNGTYFYLDENGNIAKNCEKIIDNYYYKFDADGKYVRSKLDENGQLGYVQGDYAMNQQQQYWNKKSNPFQNNQTVQWINATYAILTKNDGNHIRAFGGFLITDDLPDPEYAKNMVKTKLREGLSSAWGVTDRTSAEAVVERLIQSGQATGSAWDYSRAMSNLGFYYHADYYTLEESLDKSLEVAKMIQGTYHSWDEFVESYLVGYESWSGTSVKDRREIYEKLKASVFNPYAIDWNLELTKSW